MKIKLGIDPRLGFEGNALVFKNPVKIGSDNYLKISCDEMLKLETKYLRIEGDWSETVKVIVFFEKQNDELIKFFSIYKEDVQTFDLGFYGGDSLKINWFLGQEIFCNNPYPRFVRSGGILDFSFTEWNFYIMACKVGYKIIGGSSTGYSTTFLYLNNDGFGLTNIVYVGGLKVETFEYGVYLRVDEWYKQVPDFYMMIETGKDFFINFNNEFSHFIINSSYNANDSVYDIKVFSDYLTDRLIFDGILKMYQWTSETRPSNPFEGLLGYNVSSGDVEFYDGENWYKLQKALV